MTDGSGTTTYGYDSAGHLAPISSSNANGASMSYTYDAQGRLHRDGQPPVGRPDVRL